MLGLNRCLMTASYHPRGEIGFFLHDHTESMVGTDVMRKLCTYGMDWHSVAVAESDGIGLCVQVLVTQSTAPNDTWSWLTGMGDFFLCFQGIKFRSSKANFLSHVPCY